MPVINQVGKELGYTLIFRKFESGLIYADEAIDITNVGHPAAGHGGRRRASRRRGATGSPSSPSWSGAGSKGTRSVPSRRSAPLDAAGPRDLSFLNHPRYRGQAVASARRALLLVGTGPGATPASQASRTSC